MYKGGDVRFLMELKKQIYFSSVPQIDRRLKWTASKARVFSVVFRMDLLYGIYRI